MLKLRKYFNFLKTNRATFIDLNYGYLKSQSATAYDSVMGIQERVQQKLDDTFENQDKKQVAQFDIGKLEQIKEKANKNFFENMETRKKGKQGVVTQNNKADDLLDLDPTDGKPASTQPKTKVADDDIFGDDFNITNTQTNAPKTQKKADPYGDLDLLDDGIQVQKPQVQKPQTQDTDLMFDFQQNMNLGNVDNKKTGGLLDDDMFGDIAVGIRADDAKKNDSKAKAQVSDPFDFMSF